MNRLLMTLRTWALPLLLFSLGVNVGLLWHWGVAGGGQKGPAPIEPAERSTTPGQASLVEGPAQAPEPPNRLPRRLRRAVERMADDLALDGDSRQAFLNLQEEFFLRSRSQRNRLRKARSQLRRELVRGGADRAQAEHWLAEVSDAQQQLELAFLDNYFATRDLLAPEQEKKFLRFMAGIRDARQQLLKKAEERQRRAPRRPQSP